jgi:uncharacterized repeat protein (TIGR01451 family)
MSQPSVLRRLAAMSTAAVSVSGFAVAILAAGVSTAEASPAPPAVTDVNPNSETSGALFGGRVVAFAVNPVDTQLVFAASEFGGLWRSTNHGSSWSHVDQLPLTDMQDVQIAASDTNLVIATGGYDGSTDNRGGGIWRSLDGGSTWAKAPGSDLCAPIRFNNGRKVAIGAGGAGAIPILVGTDCGIAKSTDSGSTWTLVHPPGNNQIWDVKARQVGGNLQVDACGDGGYVRSNDGGTSWPTETDWSAATFPHPNVGSPPAPGNAGDPCRVSTAPQDANTVFMAARSPVANPGDGIGETFQLESDDGGVNWTNLNVSIDGNGRDPNAIVSPAFDGAANHFEVYFMTDQMTMHQTCDTNNTPRCGLGTGTNNACSNTNSGAWSTYDFSIPHCGTDPGDLGIDPTTGCPIVEGGDGGIFATANGCTNSPTFTNANAGLHALWVYQAATTSVPAGSAVNPAPHTSVYYGMQDNGQVCSNDDASTFHNCGGADVFNTLADRDGAPSNLLTNQNNGFRLSAEDGTTAAGWTSPPQPNLDAVAQFGFHSYAFITDNKPASGPATYQVYVTTDAGSTWTQMGPNLPGSPNANAIVASGTPTAPVFYLELNVGGPKIYRLSGPLNATATLTQTGGAGLTSPSTFAVNPAHPQRLYVVDTSGAGAALSSTNGGSSWTADATLTNIVTRGGAYPFQTPLGANISAFGFDPNSNTILAGTQFTGVYASTDNGASWTVLRGSEQIPRVQTFAFDNRNPGRAYVGSQGRGLWRIQLPNANLSITKTHSPDPVIAGNQLTWTLTVKNNGTDAAPNATVTDTLPAHDQYLSNNLNPPAGCTAAGQVVTCSLGDLAAGQSVTFKLVTLVASDTVAAAGGPTSITNTASVSSGAVESDPSDNQVEDTALVNDAADLAVTKLCKPDTQIYAGTPINCSVFVDNYGPSDARNVVLDDTILSNGGFTVSSVTVTPGPTTCTTTNVTGGKKISCTLATLPAASTTQSGRATLTYTISSTNGQNIDNTASVRSDTPDPDTSNNKVTVNLTITSVADLALTKSVSTSGVAGTAITWTLHAQNNGPSDAVNVAITDTVPAGVTINSVTMPGGSCVAGGVPGDTTHPTVCTIGTLAAGATSSNMTITATINPGTTGVLHNDARVSSDTFDSNNSNDLAHTDTTVSVASNLSVSISATPNPAVAGTPLSYKITVSNTGPSTATSVAITDPLPGGLQFNSTGGVGTCGFQTNTNTVSCTLPDIDPGGSDVLFVYTTIKPSTPPGPMSNSATASGTGSANATGSVSTTVATSADLSIVLASDLNVYKPSTTIHYQITVTNAGPSDAQHVVITQALPTVKQGKYISNNIGCAPPSGTTLTCQSPAVAALATIPAGGSVTFQVNFYITGNKGTITSSATVTSGTPDPVTSNNSSTRVVTVK